MVNSDHDINYIITSFYINFINHENHDGYEYFRLISGLIYLLSAPASPVLGILIDKTGRNVTYCFIAILVTLICHSILAFTFWDPYIAVIIMGFAYSLLASALWPIVALIIPEYQLGTAYGLMQVINHSINY